MTGRRVAAAAAAVALAAAALVGLVVAAAVGVAGSSSSAGLASMPSAPPGAITPGRPCASPLETQGFRPGPGNVEPNHTGIDFACVGDRTLVALLPGTVALARNADCGGGFGCTVVVRADVAGRDLYVRYGHVAEGSIVVAVGEEVPAGAVVATEGSTGWSTGPHVHVEVDDGALSTDRCINPAPFLDPAILR
jgi:murein DD-endopeptidase MepM/ murein hydrolase activator NlpD